MKRWSDVRKKIRSVSDSQKMSNDLANILVAEIIKYREELNLTQQQLADKAGVKQSAIARLENGGAIPRIDTFLKIADALDMKVSLTPKT